jgi:uncharacterized membrane protein YdjX (TVP38/TMEM64 family)
VRELGPLGPAAFVATISVCECVPFFPTQPLSICAGLLFGAGTGAALNLAGLTVASTIAFTLARTVGAGLAQRIVDVETGGESEDERGGAGGGGNPVAARIAAAQDAIERGGPLQQFTAILLLRLTPVVPFSASNYVLGLTPVTYGPFLGGTVIGTLPEAPRHCSMHVWHARAARRARCALPAARALSRGSVQACQCGVRCWRRWEQLARLC